MNQHSPWLAVMILVVAAGFYLTSRVDEMDEAAARLEMNRRRARSR